MVDLFPAPSDGKLCLSARSTFDCCCCCCDCCFKLEVMEVDGVVIVEYASGIGGVTVRLPDAAAAAAAAAVQFVPLLDVAVDMDGGGFFLDNDVWVFDDFWFVASDGKSSSVTTPAGFFCIATALVPSAVQPIVNRSIVVFNFDLLLASSFVVVTVSCNDGNAIADTLLKSSKCPGSLLLSLL